MENAAPLTGFPTVSSSLSYGWERMKSKFLYLFLIVLVLGIVDLPLEILGKRNDSDFSSLAVLIEALALAHWLLFVPIIDYSADLLFLKAARKEDLDLKEIAIGFKNYMNIVLTNLLVTALIGIALIALIIPGIIVACRLAFVSYLVMDKGLDPIAAVEESWKMTEGYGWRIFVLAFVSVFIFILGLIMLFVGVFPAIMWIKSSFASFYLAILNEQGPDVSAQIVPDPAL